jgi:hypothetical protein
VPVQDRASTSLWRRGRRSREAKEGALKVLTFYLKCFNFSIFILYITHSLIIISGQENQSSLYFHFFPSPQEHKAASLSLLVPPSCPSTLCWVLLTPSGLNCIPPPTTPKGFPGTEQLCGRPFMAPSWPHLVYAVTVRPKGHRSHMPAPLQFPEPHPTPRTAKALGR